MVIEQKNGGILFNKITNFDEIDVALKYEVTQENLSIKINCDDLISGKNIVKVNENIEIINPIIQMNDGFIHIYITKSKNVVINVTKELKSNYNFKIKNFKLEDQIIKVYVDTLQINKNETLSDFYLLERKTKTRINFTKSQEQWTINYNEFEIPHGIYDTFIDILMPNGMYVTKRVGKFRYTQEHKLKSGIKDVGNNSLLIESYLTYKARFLSFKITISDGEKINAFRKELPKDNIYWIVGELPNKAQDNGYFFFKYCRENHPDMPIYYVIDEEASDFENVNKLGNVIKYGTVEHYEKIARAKYIISTHHAHYLIPFDFSILEKRINYKHVFLQHGVMGTKYMANFYGKYFTDFKTDLFVVSSEREKEMIVKDFGYNENEVIVTGLPRFDSLFLETAQSDNILVIPTWRDWLVNSEDIENSEYFKRYVSLMEKLDENNIEFKFILHANMNAYADKFAKFADRVFTFEDVNIQAEMKKAKLLITDYSSVSFDFSFLNKPVIYYQFDPVKFYGKNGSHFDIYQELPGTIVSSEAELLYVLNEHINSQFLVTEEVKKKHMNLCKYHDVKNSERIYNEIIKYKFANTRSIKKQRIFQKGFNFYRRSKLYYPSIKAMYNCLKFLPKKDLIFIETTNGQALNDSPIAIYDAWSKIDSNQKFVFSYNDRLPYSYAKNAIGVKRLSPSFFYYAARSKMWINNQNFPYYLKPHKTKYLQTWHGTPMKKMFNDLDVFHGRDEGYYTRVSQANSTWKYLIAPSPYAAKCYESAFKHKAEVIELGYPRNDIFKNVEETDIKKLKIKLNIPSDKKIILYAPTFRDNAIKKKGKFLHNPMMDFKTMQEKLGEEYILILKLHPLSVMEFDTNDLSDEFIRDYTSYNEINDLLLVSDILITDYSSVMFDFLLLNKKTILYAHDLEDYEQNNRGFYMDYRTEAPGVVVEDFTTLIQEINNPAITYDIDQMIGKYCPKDDGQASERVVKFFKELDGK